MSSFAIYELPVGRGTMALSPLPADMGEELAQLVAWAPQIVVSMTNVAETPMIFHALLAAEGIQVLHVPTPDFGVPATDVAWEQAAPVITACLHKRGKVLIHCKGGCGRSGMAVLRMMIAQGEDSDEALARLRGVRPCAVETEAQLAWAKA